MEKDGKSINLTEQSKGKEGAEFSEGRAVVRDLPREEKIYLLRQKSDSAPKTTPGTSSDDKK